MQTLSSFNCEAIPKKDTLDLNLNLVSIKSTVSSSTGLTCLGREVVLNDLVISKEVLKNNPVQENEGSGFKCRLPARGNGS